MDEYLTLIYVMYRWIRLTVRRYGMLYVFLAERPRHAGVGRAVVRQAGDSWGRAHGESTGWNITTADIQAMMDEERTRELISV